MLGAFSPTNNFTHKSCGYPQKEVEDLLQHNIGLCGAGGAAVGTFERAGGDTKVAQPREDK